MNAVATNNTSFSERAHNSIGWSFKSKKEIADQDEWDQMSYDEFENYSVKGDVVSPKSFLEEYLFSKEIAEKEEIKKEDARDAYTFLHGYFDKHTSTFKQVYNRLCDEITQIIVRYSLPGGLKKIGSTKDDSLLCYANLGRFSTINETQDDWNLQDENEEDPNYKEVKKFPRVATLKHLHEIEEQSELDMTADTLMRKPSRALSVLEEMDEEELGPAEGMPVMELRAGASKNPYCEIGDFLRALLDDLNNVYEELNSLWDKYTELLKAKSWIAEEAFSTEYNKKYQELLGKQT